MSRDGRQPGWHVSPLVDGMAYHWGWLPMLLALLGSGPRHPRDYLALYLVVLALNFAHQALTLPLLWLDPGRRTRHRLAAWLLAPLSVGATALLLFLSVSHRERFGPVWGALLALNLLWNLWHVYMQKFGILRLYEVLQPGAGGRVPAWVDRLFVLSWLPISVAVLGTQKFPFLERNFRQLSPALGALREGLEAAAPVPVGLGLVVLLAGTFAAVLHEHRARRADSRPRLGMMLGSSALFAALLVLPPVKVALAFGFGHVIEYLVFVAAYEGRRGAARRPAPRIALFVLLVGALHALVLYWPRLPRAHGQPFSIAGWPVASWLPVVALVVSFAHFWLDGVLWKLRRREVSASL